MKTKYQMIGRLIGAALLVGAPLALLLFTSPLRANGSPPGWNRWVMGGYEYLAVKWKDMTWEQAVRYPSSMEFRRQYGSGWLPAGSASPEQWNAITTITKAEGFPLGGYGFALGVVQNVVLTTNIYGKIESNEPNGGWYSMIAGRPEDPVATAPAPVFAQWAHKQPDNGQKSRPWYRRPSFAGALTDIINLGINAVSPGASSSLSNAVGFVVGVITNPANRDHQDSGMIYVEKDGSIVLKDVSATQYGGGVLLMRPLTAAPGSYPGWPKYLGKPIKDGDTIPRVDAKGKIAKIDWSWAGVPLGKLRLENTTTGQVIYDGTRATPSWTVGGLPPGDWRLSIRRISPKEDPVLSVWFRLR